MKPQEHVESPIANPTNAKPFSKMHTINNVCTILGIIASVAFIIYGIKTEIFTSQEALAAFLSRFGIFAPVVFVFFQAIQVVVPILPGSIGCLAGVIFFGTWMGFVYNYVGICAGSIMAFLIAKRYGIGLVEAISNHKTFDKYIKWLNQGTRFDKLFAIAILMPVAPDDFLCYLAGTTKMTLKRFTIIILTCKPATILAYSYGLSLIMEFIRNLFVK